VKKGGIPKPLRKSEIDWDRVRDEFLHKRRKETVPNLIDHYVTDVLGEPRRHTRPDEGLEWWTRPLETNAEGRTTIRSWVFDTREEAESVSIGDKLLA